MKKHIQPKHKTLILLTIALLIISQVILYTQVFEKETADVEEQGDWSCFQTTCTRLMEEAELIKEFCFLDETGEAVCEVNYAGNFQIVPLEDLNISAFQVCAEQVCVAESLIREVNYTIEPVTN